MKTLFLAALIIACASTVTDVPSVLLGTWNFEKTTSECQGYLSCKVSFSTGENTSLIMNLLGSCSETYELQNMVADATLAPNLEIDIPLRIGDDSDWEGAISNINGTMTLTIYAPGSSCGALFTKNAATFMKATIVGVIAAISIMLI